MENKLWAVYVPGPDELWAKESKDAAEEHSKAHNDEITKNKWHEKWGMPLESVLTTVVEWPYSAEAHAEALANEEPEVMSGNDLGIPDGVAAALGLPSNDSLSGLPLGKEIENENDG